MDNAICNKCGMKCENSCVALKLLMKIYNEKRTEEKTELIHKLRPLINLVDFEPAEDIRELAEKIIRRFPDLSFINSFEVRIGYVRAWKDKRKSGRQVFAECRKVSGTFEAYLPFDFLITVYEPNVMQLSDNQKKIVLYHELRHIELTERGFGVAPHDIEDFESILREHGLNWSQQGNNVIDILADKEGGGDEAKNGNKKTDKCQAEKGRKLGSK